MNFVFFLDQGYIDASEDGFKKFADDGEELLSSNHYASDEIKEKVLHREYFTNGIEMEAMNMYRTQVLASLSD